jgi:hypothetical protein
VELVLSAPIASHSSHGLLSHSDTHTALFTGKVQIRPVSVSQSSTDSKRTADLAIDGKLGTSSKTKCPWNSDEWFKMMFDAIRCFSEIVIINRTQEKWRMQDTKVYVLNSQTETESYCGVLRVRDASSIKGQTYSISCDLKCGDKVKLKVRHNHTYVQPGCIQLREISAYGTEREGRSYLD